jgi:hypothetical protein
MPRKLLFCLGRYGDICNVLPLAYHLNKIGQRVTFCVSAQFAGILDGVSYVDPLIWPGNYNDPAKAYQWLKFNRPYDEILIGQSYRNPVDKQRHTDSYQRESWLSAGALAEFGAYPLVFDRRDASQDGKLLGLLNNPRIILVATESVSSPIKSAREVYDRITLEFPNHAVVDLSAVKCHRIYDLIGWYNRAECLVTVDSVHLHLSRASKVPTVAILQNGYFSSVPPPACVRSVHYSEMPMAMDYLLAGIRLCVDPKDVEICHVTDAHGESIRHDRARATWLPVSQTHIQLRLNAIAPAKRLTLTDCLKTASESEAEVIIWSNSDNGFTDGAFQKIARHVQIFGACSIRRQQSPVHIGRDAFGFTHQWLTEHLHEIPPFYLGAPCFDLVLAALIRKQRGIPSTLENMHEDFYPCEMEPGLVTHEDHPSSWAGDGEHTRPENVANVAMARDWVVREMPGLKL